MAILSLSGKAGSGKDLVAKIIQYLTGQPFHQGKLILPPTIENYVTGTCEWDRASFVEQLSPFKVRKFAYKVKQIATILTGVPIENWEDQEFKKQEMPPEWDVFKQVSENEPDGNSVRDGYLKVPMTYREFLQKLGTEAIRNGLHVNTWCNALMSEYKALNLLHCISSEGLIPPVFPNWIISDMRFPNEYETVKEKGGICIRIERDNFKYSEVTVQDADYKVWEDSIGNKMCFRTESYSKQESFDKFSYEQLSKGRNYGKGLHSSETSLDMVKFDYYLCNSGTIEDLIEEVRKMLVHFKLIADATAHNNTERP